MKYKIFDRDTRKTSYIEDESSSDALETYLRKKSVNNKIYRSESVIIAKISRGEDVPEWIKSIHFTFFHDRDLINWEFFIIRQDMNDLSKAYYFDDDDDVYDMPSIAECSPVKQGKKR